MGRKPCCLKEEVNRGAWSLQEDKILTNYIDLHGEGKWRTLPQKAGLNRCGKSCRLRWMNYLRPGIKRGNITPDEEDLILRLHRLLGNRWSLIAGRLPGRTDNEIKNYWNSVLSKKLNVDVSKPSNEQCECEGEESQSVDKHISGSSSTPNVIVPKATRCTKILISVDEGRHLMNKQCCPPSNPADHFDDEEFKLESKTDNEVQTPNALDSLDLSHAWIEDMFETMLESELAPMFEMEFDNLNSSLGLEDEWRDLF